jgi:hypothetical protein
MAVSAWHAEKQSKNPGCTKLQAFVTPRKAHKATAISNLKKDRKSQEKSLEI